MTTTTKQPDWFATGWFGQCMSSTRGRTGRVVAGLALIVGGLSALGGTAGIVLAAIGLVATAERRDAPGSSTGVRSGPWLNRILVNLTIAARITAMLAKHL